MDHRRDSVARRLAESHFHLDEDIKRIFRVLAPDEVEIGETEPVKLLEVNSHTSRDGIVPVYFGSHSCSGLIYPSVIIEIHPDELADLTAGKLQLPDGWRLGAEFERPLKAVSA